MVLLKITILKTLIHWVHTWPTLTSTCIHSGSFCYVHPLLSSLSPPLATVSSYAHVFSHFGKANLSWDTYGCTQFMSPAHPGLSLAEIQTAAVIVQEVSHQLHSVCVYCVCEVCVSVCSCPVPRWWILIDVRSLLSVSQLPSALIPAQGFMKPGG